MEEWVSICAWFVTAFATNTHGVERREALISRPIFCLQAQGTRFAVRGYEASSWVYLEVRDELACEGAWAVSASRQADVRRVLLVVGLVRTARSVVVICTIDEEALYSKKQRARACCM